MFSLNGGCSGWPRRVSLLLLALCGVLVALAQSNAAPAVYPFAMCSNPGIRNNPAYPPAMVATGARMVRSDFTFAATRPTDSADPNTWNWKAFDDVVKLKAQYPTLDWLALLGYGAQWAKDPKITGTREPAINAPEAGIDIMPANDPGNLYGAYVYECVKRYHNTIHVWESWNEPDLPGHAFFIGGGADFFPYQKACYLAAKAADPSCTVLFAGMSFANVEGYLSVHGLKAPSPYPPKSSFFEEYLQAAAKDPDAKKNHYYFDAMNQHSYSRATDLYDYAEVNRKLMRDYIGEQKPIWITEMGITDNATPTNGQIFGCSPDEYCDYLLQSYAWGKLAGVEKFVHFQLDNSNGHGLYKGMLGDPKVALATYRDILTAEFADADMVAQRHGHAGVGLLDGNSAFDQSWKQGYDLFEFTADRGKKHIWMAFADTIKDVDIAIPATKKSAVLVDRHNVRSAIDATGGVYKLHLAGATNVGGWPAGDNPAGKALGSPENLIYGATQIVIEK